MTNNQEISEEEARSYLSFYVADSERLDAYIARLHSAPSLKEVERILVAMVRAEGIPTDILTRQEFYMTVRVLFSHLKAVRATLYEHFVDIQRAARSKAPADEEQARLSTLFSGGIELAAPKPGEEGHYLVELVITVSREHSDRLLMSANLVSVKHRPVDLRGFDGEGTASAGLCTYSLKGTPTCLTAWLNHYTSLPDADVLTDIHYKSPSLDRRHLTVDRVLNLLRAESSSTAL